MYIPTVYFGWVDSLAATAGSAILAPGGTRVSLHGNQPTPVTYNYSFGIQQTDGPRHDGGTPPTPAPSHATCSGNGTSTRSPLYSRFLDMHPENKDPTSSAALATNFLRPYQGVADVNMVEFGGTSSYNAGLLSFQRRMSKGLHFGFSYSFSKVLGTASTNNTIVSSFFAPRSRHYGPLTYDLTHVASIRYAWTLPKPGKRYGIRFLGLVTDGWEMAGTSRFSTGGAFTPGLSTVDGQDITGTPSESARVNVGDPNAPEKERFTRPARTTFGNAGSGILRAPGINNWDISTYKTFNMRERLRLQLRFESYNTFNHTQFSSLTTTARFDATGKQVDTLFLEPAAARSPRRVQLAMRLNW